MSKKRGRPKGAKNIKESAIVAPSRCPNCQSSLRTAYSNTYYEDYSGRGQEFIGIKYRTCHCLECGQARRDRERVFAAKPVNPAGDQIAPPNSDDQ